MPSPLDRTLLSGSSCSRQRLHALPPAPACTTTCTCMHYHLRLHALPPVLHALPPGACSTHILFDLSMAMSGSGGYLVSPAPAMSKVLLPVFLLDVASSEVSGSLSVSPETRAFIPKNRDVIKPLFHRMMSSFCILIGCQGTTMPPSGDFFIFPCFLVQKGQMSSGFL